MIRKLVFSVIGISFLYIALLFFMMIFNLTVFIISVEKFQGGTIELDKETRNIMAGDSFIVFMTKIDHDSEVTLKCNGNVDKAGYITPIIYQFIYIEIEDCEIKEFHGYDMMFLVLLI